LGKVRVSPLHCHSAKGDSKANVCSGKTMCERGGCASTQVDRGKEQEQHRTEQQYLFWIRRFILFHGKRHPSDMATREVEDFLTHLAVDRKVSASTQNQALAAILFLYQKVMQVELPWLGRACGACRSGSG
jgi:hypothetical protein